MDITRRVSGQYAYGDGMENGFTIGGKAKMQENVVVSCRYRTLLYFFLAALSLGLAAFSLWGAVGFAVERVYEPMFIFLGLVVIFGLLGAALIGFIKNYAVLFCRESIVYRNMFGRSCEYSYAQVERYRIFRNPFSPGKSTISIFTKERIIVINGCCSNFDKACTFLEQSQLKSEQL